MIRSLRLAQLDRRWKWAALGAALVLAVFLLWFFVFRSTGTRIVPANTPPPPRVGLGQTISYADYTKAVDGALQDVRDAQSADTAARSAKEAAAASALEQVDGASISGGPGAQSTVQVDNSAIIEELKGTQPNLPAIVASLSALSQGLHGTGAATPGNNAQSSLQQVLSDPAFNYKREPTLIERLAHLLAGNNNGNSDSEASLLPWLLAAVAGIIAGIITFLATDRIKNRWARLGIAVVVGLLVAAIFGLGVSALGTTIELLGALGLVVAFVAVLVLTTGAYRASAPSSKPKTVSDLAAVLGMGSREAKRRAEESAVSGDYRSAIRFRSLGVLLALDEAGQLLFDRAATNREYLFRAPGPLQDDLQALLERFSAVWYGGAPAGEEEWREVGAKASNIEGRAAAEAQAHSAAQVHRTAA